MRFSKTQNYQKKCFRQPINSFLLLFCNLVFSFSFFFYFYLYRVFCAMYMLLMLFPSHPLIFLYAIMLFFCLTPKHPKRNNLVLLHPFFFCCRFQRFFFVLSSCFLHLTFIAIFLFYYLCNE